MLEFLLQGFLLGLAYLAPIGMQNMYVINSAMRMGRLKLGHEFLALVL